MVARITVGVHPAAVTVPAVALVPDGEAYRVYVVDSGGTAHVREVDVGARQDSLVELRHGVAAGEVVVTEGAYGVEDGARVVEQP